MNVSDHKKFAKPNLQLSYSSLEEIRYDSDAICMHRAPYQTFSRIRGECDGHEYRVGAISVIKG